MKQETLEKAAEAELYLKINKIIDGGKDLQKGFNVSRAQAIDYAFEIALKFAKWQQERMYSEEDLIELLNFVTKEYNISNGIGWFHTHDSIEDVSSKEVLEQFKKK